MLAIVGLELRGGGFVEMASCTWEDVGRLCEECDVSTLVGLHFEWWRH